MDELDYPSDKVTLQAMPLLVLAAYAGTILADQEHRRGELSRADKEEVLEIVYRHFLFALRFYFGKLPPEIPKKRV